VKTDTSDLMDALGVTVDAELLRVALTHRSYSYENGGVPTNERLEFLGDSVLGIVVTEGLYRQFPDWSEGQLAKLRSAVVNATALSDVARTLGLGEYLYLGRGEDSTGGRDKTSILADTMEAVLGAVFLDLGMDAAAQVVRSLIDPLVERAAELGAGLDWKTSLQEAVALMGRGAPQYQVTDVGPDHAKVFSAEALVDGEMLGAGTGQSKKVAEQHAAAAAYERIRADHPELGLPEA
jgi:ribonuclease-3